MYEVTVTRREIIVKATPHWPITPRDIALNQPEDWDGESREGIVVESHKYLVKRLELESW